MKLLWASFPLSFLLWVGRLLKCERGAPVAGLLFFLGASFLHANVDLVIFSYDRPLQLCALLESIDLNVSGLHEETVIYRASCKEFEEGYALVKHAFPHVLFKAQNHLTAKADFKPLVLSSMFSSDSSARYALFAVDDNVVTRPINLAEATEAMERYDAYAFFFRLGLNINYCYMTDTYSGVPDGTVLEPSLFSWVMGNGKGDWGYPNNVDLTLYRKQDIRFFFQYYPYTFPNDMEAAWSTLARKEMKGLCYTQSCVVNIPMNVVSSFRNRQMSYKTPLEFLSLFLEGYKMDITPLQGIENNSPHFEVKPLFIPR